MIKTGLILGYGLVELLALSRLERSRCLKGCGSLEMAGPDLK